MQFLARWGRAPGTFRNVTSHLALSLLLPDDSWQLSHGTLPVVFSLFPFFSCYGLAPGMQLTTPALWRRFRTQHCTHLTLLTRWHNTTQTTRTAYSVGSRIFRSDGSAAAAVGTVRDWHSPPKYWTTFFAFINSFQPFSLFSVFEFSFVCRCSAKCECVRERRCDEGKTGVHGDWYLNNLNFP